VTSVREKEEKANTIQPPLLVFFSPSKFTSSSMGHSPKTHVHAMF